MNQETDLIAQDILAYLDQHERKEILRFLTCGSVDDGKSTLIGRLLHDSKMIYEDQLQSIRQDTKNPSTADDNIDLAMLVDGLQAEREQGITIDVAYRYFSTTKRKFIIADTPGHEQYTRNMVTGASTCDVAVILIDARYGVMPQTRRHTFIASLLGIKHIIVAVNKMDLVDYAEGRFEEIRDAYFDFATKLAIEDLHFIPMSALQGDNVVDASDNMPWYQGSTLMHLLENIHIGSDRNLTNFRFPVQRVNRPDASFRGYSGTVVSGTIKAGDAVVVLPSGRPSEVTRVVTMDGDLTEAYPPLAVTLTLADEIDISRGDVLVKAEDIPRVQDRLTAHLVWMWDAPLAIGKQYILKHGAKQVYAQVTRIQHRIDINSLESEPASNLELNEIARCELSLSEPVAFDAYTENRETGAFILIDRMSNATLAAGMIAAEGATATRDHWDEPPHGTLQAAASPVSSEELQSRLNQRAVTLLLTGLSKSGKSAIANRVQRKLFDRGYLAAVLDGQNFRLGMSRDLGFSAPDRSENMRRATETARLMNQAGLICLTAFVVPREEVRQRTRDALGENQFLEVYLTAPLDVLKQRDDSGLYAAAERGEIPSFPGVSAEFDVPVNPALSLDTGTLSIDACAEAIIDLMQQKHIIG